MADDGLSAIFLSVDGEEDYVDRGKNAYCERLGISVPNVEKELQRKKAPTLFHLLVVALLEKGAPMSMQEIGSRLLEAGFLPRTGDIMLSLKRSWRGREPVYKDPGGLMRLDLECTRLKYLLFDLRPKRKVERRPDPPAVFQPGPTARLQLDELEAAFEDRSLWSLSLLRQAAAVLDAYGEPMAVQEVEACLSGLTKYRPSLTLDNARRWRTTMIHIGGDNLKLVMDDPGLPAMRTNIRKLARPVLQARIRRQQARSAQAEWKKRDEARSVKEQEEARSLSRAVVRAFPHKAVPAGAAVLDVSARTIRTFVGKDIDGLAEHLGEFDLLAGPDMRDLLHRMGLDVSHWKLVELGPPRKTIQITKTGRKLKLTSEMLVTHSTGISRPLGDPKRLARYVKEGAHAGLRRRLESDVKSLYAFYRFGLLHGCVRCQWGFLDEVLPVDWAGPGDRGLYWVLKEAMESGREIEIVMGTAPGWKDPWSRKQRCTVLGVEAWSVTLLMDGLRHLVSKLDIQMVRPVDEPGDERGSWWAME